MTTVEDKIHAFRQVLLQIEAQQGQTVVLARKALGEIEEDVRELRREELKRNIEFFTEEQLATRVGISRTSIKKLRRDGLLVPCNVGGPLRYSSFHVECLARVPEATAQPKARPRKHPHLEAVTQQRRQG